MDIKEKAVILQKLDTKDLVDKLHSYENSLQKALTERMTFISTNHGFIATRDNDCLEVKRLLAELAVKTPETNEETSKKLTVADKENWLMLQRKEDKELSEAIAKQRQVAFLLDGHQITIDMAKKRLEGIIAVIALKTAQINFLAS